MPVDRGLGGRSIREKTVFLSIKLTEPVQQLAGAPEIASGTLSIPHPYPPAVATAPPPQRLRFGSLSRIILNSLYYTPHCFYHCLGVIAMHVVARFL